MRISISNGVVLIAVLFCVGKSVKLCETKANCTAVPGCTCLRRAKSLELGFCFNSNASRAEMRKECKTCDRDDECDERGCQGGYCTSCILHMANEGYGNCSNFSFQYCSKSSCGKPGCTCREFNNTGSSEKICSNNDMFKKDTAGCRNCTKNSDCPGSYCTNTMPILGRKICDSCESKPRIDAFGACSFGIADRNDIRDLLVNPPTPTPSTTPSPGFATLMSNNESTSEPKPCVSTEWLRQNALYHAAIHHSGRADVLCIEGLPCGTHGHLLRDANGKLVTYRQACIDRTDCVASVMRVSQLSHTFDWSRFRNFDGSLTLTSLSVHPSATGLAPSRVVAYAAEALIAARLGWVCNAIVLLLHRVQPSIQYLLASLDS